MGEVDEITAVTSRGKKLDTASLGEIRVEVPADLAALSAVTLLERSITDLRSVAFECHNFCQSIAAAIYQTELPEVQSSR